MRAHLDHVRELGATAVYLTPIFPARSNHRYNASNFSMVDPLLGGDEALARLAAACHENGLQIIGDLTTNHSGDDHPWFQAALGDPTAPERAFYYVGPDGKYVSWLGHETLPKFDLDSAELRERMFGAGDSVVSRWLREPYNLDGWRIDVANMTGRQGIHDHGNAVATLIRETLDAVRPESVLLAEYTNDFTADLRGDGWQGSMNYAGFGRPVWSWLESAEYEQSLLGLPYRIARRSGRLVVETMREFAAAVPWKVATRHWNLTSSHDTARIRTVTGSGEGVRLAAALLFTYPGTPMIFAGDEWGLEGVNGEDARRPMPWDRPDGQDQSDLRRVSRADRGATGASCPAARRAAMGAGLGRGDRVPARDGRRANSGRRLPVCVVGALLPAAPRRSGRNPYGDVDLTLAGGAILLPGEGPAAGIWRLA